MRYGYKRIHVLLQREGWRINHKRGRSFKATDVVTALNRAVKRQGKPKTIRVDNGPEFVPKEVDLWAYANGVVLDFSRPGKPTDNAFIESFDSRVRAECLNQTWFLSLEDEVEKVERWRVDYNLV